MSNLENTIEEVMMEANAPVAKSSSEKPDPDAEKKLMQKKLEKLWKQIFLVH